jgi:probable HAF family extracellular repeat protein
MNTKKILLFSLLAPLPAIAGPQFTVIDLGPMDRPGAGLFWHVIQGQTDSRLASLVAAPINNVAYQLFGLTGVGSSEVDPGGNQVHAALWQPTSSGNATTVTDLGVLPDADGDPDTAGPQSAAYAMNSIGDIVGWSQTDNVYAYSGSGFYHVYHAFLWNGGVMHDLGTLAIPNPDPQISHGYGSANYSSLAEGVNDFHEVVGWANSISSATNDTLKRAFYYANGTMYNLTYFLSGAPGTLRLTEALSIDCQGNIAALGFDMNGGGTHSYLLTRVGAARTCQP